MEVINEKDHNAGCLAVYVSKSGGHASGSRPLEVDNAVDKNRETGKCRHFSIRRYVAEVRKKDWKSCWPFVKSEDHHELEQYSKLLPPLSVPEFRWWDCRNCIKKNDTDRAGEVSLDYVGDQRALVVVANGEALLPSDNAIESFHGVQSGKSTSKGGDVTENVLENMQEKEVTSIVPFIGDASEKMVQSASPDRYNQVTENDVHQINSGKRCDVSDAEPCKRGERTAEDTCEVTITFDLNKPACNLSLIEPLCAEPISCDLVTSEVAVTGSPGYEEHFQEVLPDQEISVVGSHLASPTSMNTGVAEPNGWNDIEVTDEITKEIHGRSPFVDVITVGDMSHNAAVIPVNELNIPSLTETDDGSHAENFNLDASESPSCPSNGMLQQKRTKKMRSLIDILRSEQSEHLVSSNENCRNPNKSKGNKQKKMLGVENSETSLMCRSNDMLEKLPGLVVDDGSNKPEIHVGSRTEEKDKENISVEKEYSGVAREERQELSFGSWDDCSREAVTKNNDTDTMSKKNKKLPRIIDDLNSLPQDSPGIGKCRTIQDSQPPQEVTTYQRAAPVNNERHQDASLDDIPMDIVELLAKNQHERCLLNAEAATEGRADKLPTPQSTSFKIIDFIGKSMENSENKVDKPTHTSSNGNDIGFKKPGRSAQGFVPWSQSKTKTTGIQFLSPNHKRDHETMSLTCSQWLDQCHKNQMGLPESSFRPPIHRAAEPLQTIPHNASSAKAGSSTNADGSNSPKLTNLDFSFHPQSKKAKFQTEMSREHIAPCSYRIAAEGRNTGVQMEGPTSEKMPATHLLRLMNQGASSSTPATRIHESQGNFLHKNHFGHSQAREIDPESGGVDISRSSQNHRSFQSIHQKQQEGKSLELFPPMARVSSTASLSPDIPTCSDSYGLSVSFTPRAATQMQEVASSQAHRKKKTRVAPSLGQSTNLRPNDFVPTVDISSHTDIFPLRGVLTGFNIEENNKNASPLPVESSRNTEICVVNRNPADFTIPEDGNIYMIGSDELRCKNLSPPKEPDARKRQRTLKLTALQRH